MTINCGIEFISLCPCFKGHKPGTQICVPGLCPLKCYVMNQGHNLVSLVDEPGTQPCVPG